MVPCVNVSSYVHRLKQADGENSVKFRKKNIIWISRKYNILVGAMSFR